MKDKDISSLVVVDKDGIPQGLVTERDLVTKICINDFYTSTITDRQRMLVQVISIDPIIPPTIVVDMMLHYNSRRSLVVNDMIRMTSQIQTNPLV
jgi:CBS domain-containing protein